MNDEIIFLPYHRVLRKNVYKVILPVQFYSTSSPYHLCNRFYIYISFYRKFIYISKHKLEFFINFLSITLRLDPSFHLKPSLLTYVELNECI